MTPEEQQFQMMLAKALQSPEVQQALKAQHEQQKSAAEMELGIAGNLGEAGLREQMAMHTIPQRMELASGQMGAENDVIKRQLAQAQALQRGSGGRNFGTAAGNIAAGVGDTLGGFFGGRRESELLDAMRANNGSGFGQMGGMLDRMDDAGFTGLKAQHDYMRGFRPVPLAQPPTSPYANASSFGDGVQLVPFELPKKNQPMAMSQLMGMKIPGLGG